MTRVIIAGSRDFYSPGIFNNVMTEFLSDIPEDEIVDVKQDGSYLATFVGSMHGKEEIHNNE